MNLDPGTRLTRRDLARLAPAIVPVAGLSLAALYDALATSLGVDARSWTHATAHAYRVVIGLPGFWASYAFSVWIAVAATAIAATAAALIGYATTRHETRTSRWRFAVLQFNLGVAHLVWAVALAAVLAPSGWIARIVAWSGIIDRPNQFPVLVNDDHGLGIILHLVTKETPFLVLATIPLASRRLVTQLRQAATLGANRWATLRHVYLPGVAPALVPGTIVVFAYALGAYEPAAVLGVQRPRTLAVVAVEWFRDPDLRMRAQAFAVSTILLATVVAAAAVVLLITRNWWTIRANSSLRAAPTPVPA